MKHVRIFTAINLSVASVRKIAELQQELQRSRSPGLKLRWVPPANIHVTLKFYGNLAVEQVEAVRRAAREAAAEVRPFAVSAQGLGVFPNPSRPRVLWVGLGDGAAALQTLAERLEATSARLGFAEDPRPFRPHLTIARVKQGNAGVAQWLEEHAETDCLISTVEELVVYESRTLRTGAEYVAHARIPLGEPRDRTSEPPEPPAAPARPEEPAGKEGK
jgi:2'-5' RNA ligase